MSNVEEVRRLSHLSVSRVDMSPQRLWIRRSIYIESQIQTLHMHWTDLNEWNERKTRVESFLVPEQMATPDFSSMPNFQPNSNSKSHGSLFSLFSFILIVSMYKLQILLREFSRWKGKLNELAWIANCKLQIAYVWIQTRPRLHIAY